MGPNLRVYSGLTNPPGAATKRVDPGQSPVGAGVPNIFDATSASPSVRQPPPRLRVANGRRPESNPQTSGVSFLSANGAVHWGEVIVLDGNLHKARRAIVIDVQADFRPGGLAGDVDCTQSHISLHAR